MDRIIDQFPADRQSQIRTMMSESLKAVIAQTLVKKIGGGRAAAQEVLIVNSAVSNLIREGKTFQIASIMQTQRGSGMVTLNDALYDLVKRKLVTAQDALSKAIALKSPLTIAVIVVVTFLGAMALVRIFALAFSGETARRRRFEPERIRDVGGRLGELPPPHLFVDLRELPRDGDLPERSATREQVRHRREHPVRGFEQHRRASFRSDGGQAFAPRRAPTGQEPVEHEASGREPR